MTFIKRMIAGFVVGLGLLLLAGCATTASLPAGSVTPQAPSVSAGAQFYNMCVDYRAAVQMITSFGKYLTPAQVSQVSMITQTITPICETPPTNAAQETQTVSAALTQLAIYEGLEAAAAKKGGTP